MEVTKFISENWVLASGFFSGMIAGNPRTIKKLLGIFTMFFALYKIFLFFRELKNPAFRKFLASVFTSIVLIISIVFFTFATYGCSSQSIITTLQITPYEELFDEDELTDSDNDSLEFEESEIKAIPSFVISDNATTDEGVNNYLNQFTDLAKKIKSNHITEIKNEKVIFKNQKRVFKEKRANVRENLIVSCNVLASKLRADNSKLHIHSRSFGKYIIEKAANVNISKRQLLRLPLNVCEKYGVSLLFRLKHKAKHARFKWLSCSDFASKGFIPVEHKNTYYEMSTRIKKLALQYRLDYKVLAKCKLDTKLKYFQKLKMGLFPSRRLNE